MLHFPWEKEEAGGQMRGCPGDQYGRQKGGRVGGRRGAYTYLHTEVLRGISYILGSPLLLLSFQGSSTTPLSPLWFDKSFKGLDSN